MTLSFWAVASVIALVVLGLDWFSGVVIKLEPQPIEKTVPELGIAYEDLRIESGGHELAAWLIKPAEVQPFEPLV
ncbi:MAG TPA: hypothetical protein DIT46_07425, partial [Gemmatimonadetes bacterium]|nr:hypothetical protein [Gemmatimonadota bacterium]